MFEVEKLKKKNAKKRWIKHGLVQCDFIKLEGMLICVERGAGGIMIKTCFFNLC